MLGVESVADLLGWDRPELCLGSLHRELQRRDERRLLVDRELGGQDPPLRGPRLPLRVDRGPAELYGAACDRRTCYTASGGNGVRLYEPSNGNAGQILISGVMFDDPGDFSLISIFTQGNGGFASIAVQGCYFYKNTQWAVDASFAVVQVDSNGSNPVVVNLVGATISSPGASNNWRAFIEKSTNPGCAEREHHRLRGPRRIELVELEPARRGSRGRLGAVADGGLHGGVEGGCREAERRDVQFRADGQCCVDVVQRAARDGRRTCRTARL